MNVLVTGASGAIGRSVIEHLCTLNDVRVTAVARSALGSPPLTPQVRWIAVDLGSKASCAEIVRNQDAVIHLASTSFPMTSDDSVALDVIENLLPTVNLLEAIRDAGTAPHLVYPSSGGAVYGNRLPGRPLTEMEPCEPLSSYGIGKLTAEHYIRVFAEQNYLTATVLRIGNAYGWHVVKDRPQGFVDAALRMAKNAQPIMLYGNLNNVRDYVYVDDVARAIHLALVYRSQFEIINIGTGIGISVLDVIRALEQVLHIAVDYTVQPNARADRLPFWNVLDVSKAKHMLRWEYTVGLLDGLGLMLRAQV